nr:MAG TPA: hypothetical protein [Caudoviricetes sp.]
MVEIIKEIKKKRQSEKAAFLVKKKYNALDILAQVCYTKDS